MKDKNFYETVVSQNITPLKIKYKCTMLVEKACNNKCYLPAKLYPNELMKNQFLLSNE